MVPASQRGSLYRTKKGWGIRWYENGKRRHESGFKSQTEAREWWHNVVRPRLLGIEPEPDDITLTEFVTQ